MENESQQYYSYSKNVCFSFFVEETPILPSGF